MAKKKKKSAFRGKVKSDVKRQKDAASSYGYLKLPKDVKVYAPEPGSKEKFDILPYTVTSKVHPDKNPDVGIAEKGDVWYKRPFKAHRSVGADNDSIVCLSSFGKKCPICEYRKKLIKEDADETVIKSLKPSNRNLYYVIPRGIKKLEEEVHILDFSQWNFQNLLGEEIEENEDYEVFPDLSEGLTLKVRWEEDSFMKNTFAKAGRIDFLERDEEIAEDIVDDLPSLDDVLTELSYEALYAKFHEIEEGEEEDEESEEDEEVEDEVETPKKKSRKKPPVEEDEEEEEDASIDHDMDWSDIVDMDVSELVDVIEEYDLKTDADDVEDVEELQKQVAKELDIEIPKPKKKKTPVKKKKKSTEGTCPEGHKWGIDNDKFDECEECPLWDACLENE